MQTNTAQTQPREKSKILLVKTCCSYILYAISAVDSLACSTAETGKQANKATKRLEFGGVGVAELVDACALIRAFDGLRMAERAFLVGVPVDDDPVLEFALAEADQVVDRMRGEGRIEVDEVGVDEVAGGRDRRRVDCHAVLRCGDAQPQS